MDNRGNASAFFLGVFIFLGLAALGYLLGKSAIQFKEYERSVAVKGLAEREYPADIVLWPIQFTVADNDLTSLYNTLEANTGRIRAFLKERGIQDSRNNRLPARPHRQIRPAVRQLVATRIPLHRHADGDGLFRQRDPGQGNH